MYVQAADYSDGGKALLPRVAPVEQSVDCQLHRAGSTQGTLERATTKALLTCMALIGATAGMLSAHSAAAVQH